MKREIDTGWISPATGGLGDGGTTVIGDGGTGCISPWHTGLGDGGTKI